MFGQRIDDFIEGTSGKSLLLRATPLVRCLGSASWSGLCQILADVVKVTEECPTASKGFLGLQPNPFRAISYCVDLAIKPTASAPGTVAPAPPQLPYFAKRSGINSLRAALGLRRCQTYFFPLPRPFTFPSSGANGANHAAVRLSHHVLGSHLWQSPERLVVFLFQDLLCPLSIFQSCLAYRACITALRSMRARYARQLWKMLKGHNKSWKRNTTSRSGLCQRWEPSTWWLRRSE